MLSIGFRILTLPLSLLILLQLALTSPIPERPSQPNFTDRLGYSQFQISDGYGGDAEARAAAVFKEPLAGLNLSELPYDAFDQIAVMREATEDAHREAFVPQIASAPSDRKRALEVGQVKNLVLLYTATVQLMEIKLAKDVDDEGRMYENEMDLVHASSHLQSLLNTDRQNQGIRSLSVQWPLE